jgi:hypothetical protein
MKNIETCARRTDAWTQESGIWSIARGFLWEHMQDDPRKAVMVLECRVPLQQYQDCNCTPARSISDEKH